MKLERRTLLLAAATAGCGRGVRPSSALARGALELARRSAATPLQALDLATAELSLIAARVRAHRARHAEQHAAEAISQVLFDELGFVREVDSTALDFVLLPTVLQQRRGSCVGLGTLYLCVAEELGFGAHGVLRPGHFYVQHLTPGAARNVELLRRGEAMSQDWYARRFPLAQDEAHSYGRALLTREVLGVTAFNVGNERRREHRLRLAQRAYAEAVTLFPTFAEAHASLGTTQQLLGDTSAASMSYERALKLAPSLSGVASNSSLLER